MIDEPLKEQASLYVAGALPADKAHEFEQVMRGNLELQLLVSECRHSLDAIVMSLPRRSPSPSLKAKIMRRIESRPASAQALAVVPPNSGKNLWTLLPWALAACLAFLCVVLLSRGREERTQIVDMEQRLKEAEGQTQRAEKMIEAQKFEFQKQRQQISEMIVQQSSDRARQFIASSNQLVERIRVLEHKGTDPAVRREMAPQEPGGITSRTPVPLIPALPGGGGTSLAAQPSSFLGVLRSAQPNSPALGAVSWDAREQRGVVLIEQLSPPAVDQDYQLWMIVDGVAISGGLLKYDSAGRIQFSFIAGNRISKVDSFAVSVERKGGVESPQGTVILATN